MSPVRVDSNEASFLKKATINVDVQKDRTNENFYVLKNQKVLFQIFTKVFTCLKSGIWGYETLRASHLRVNLKLHGIEKFC